MVRQPIPEGMGHLSLRAKVPFSASSFIPSHASLSQLREAAKTCKGCPLYRAATQTVFGEGPAQTPIVMLGEQPGNQEDKEGRPFVGPAGRLLDKALAEVHLQRENIYISNVVKHFKFKWKAKIRFHQKPTGLEIRACRPWLQAELTLLKPKVTVCLGVSAAQGLLQRKVLLREERGQMQPSPLGGKVLFTTHPSSILRMPDEQSRHSEFKKFVQDLSLISKELKNDRR